MGLFSTIFIYKTGKRRQRKQDERARARTETPRPRGNSQLQETLDAVLEENERRKREHPIQQVLDGFTDGK